MEQNEKARYKKWFPFTTYDLDELNNRDIVFCFHHAGGSASVYRKSVSYTHLTLPTT